MRAFFVGILVAFALAGCGERIVFNDEGVDLVVVDATLIVDRPMPGIWITRSLGPQSGVDLGSFGNVGGGGEFDVDEATLATLRAIDRATEDAADVIVVAGADTTVFRQVRIDVPGASFGLQYVPDGAPPVVLPDTRYDLTIRTDRGETVTATTRTPPRFEVNEWVLMDENLNDVATLLDFDQTREAFERGDIDVATPYEVPGNKIQWDSGLLEARFDRDVRVRAYQVGLASQDLESGFAIEPDFFEDEDFDDIDREGSSPMFEAPDGRVRLPWFAVFFEGPYRIKIFATDENWNDFVVSTPSLTAGNNFGGNAGDAFSPAEFDVEGGIGIFGSASVDSIGFCVYRDEPDSVSCVPTR